jgi:hypothetical protein
MSDLEVKVPKVLTIASHPIIWIVGVIFMGGVAFATFATRDLVDAKIETARKEWQRDLIEHSAQQKEQFEEIRSTLKRIEDRQYDIVQKGRAK